MCFNSPHPVSSPSLAVAMAGTLLSFVPDSLQGGTISLSMMKLKVLHSFLWFLPPGDPGSISRCGLASTELVVVHCLLTVHGSSSVVLTVPSVAPIPNFGQLLESSPSIHVQCILECLASMVFCPSSYCPLFKRRKPTSPFSGIIFPKLLETLSSNLLRLSNKVGAEAADKTTEDRR